MVSSDSPASGRTRVCSLLRGGLVVVALAALAACQANVRASTYWTPENQEETRPLRETETLHTLTADAPKGADAATMLGVRHDLALAPTEGRAATCSCLTAVVAEGATSAAFQWDGDAPRVGSDALVFAMSTRGVECAPGPADPAQRRASIAAVDVEGADVVVVLEDLPDGRPLAQGAIIPRPGAGGSVVVRPRSPKVVYGRALGLGAARCKVY
jgi:hypothetical protein